MKRNSQKGKISRDQWPIIVEKYKEGATMAELGRKYGCTPPAIRYILTKVGAISAPTASRAQPSYDVTNRRELCTEQSLDFGQGSSRQTARQVEMAQRLMNGQRAKRGVDVELRKRISADLANLLVAIDQAAVNDPDSLNTLEDAIDRLMRSAARVRIELERWLIDIRAAEDEEGRLRGRSRVGVAQ